MLKISNKTVAIFQPAGVVYGSEQSVLSFLSFTSFNCVCVCPSSGNFAEKLKRLKTPMENLEFNKYSFAKNPFWNILFAARVYMLLRSHRADAVIINLDTNIVIITILCRLMKLPLVRYCRFEFIGPVSRLHTWCWKQCRLIIAPSECVLSQLDIWKSDVRASIPTKRIYDSVEISSQDTSNRPSEMMFDRKHICFVGRIDRNKGIHLLLQGMSLLKEDHSDLDVVIIGAHDNSPAGALYCNELLALIERYDLGGRVKMLGYREHPQKYMKYADVLVLPSYSESLGMVLLESWLTGTPTVASNVSGCNEITKLSNGGMLFEVGNVDDLSNKIDTMLLSQAEWNLKAQSASQWVNSCCNPKVYSSQLDECIKEIIGES